MLGDGSIQHNTLVVNRSSNDRRYNCYLKNEFLEICKRDVSDNKYIERYICENGVKRKICSSCCCLQTVTTEQLKQLRKMWYIANIEETRNRKFNKVIPIDFVLSTFCARSLAFWYLDDGSVTVGGNNGIKLFTNDFTITEVIFLKDLLKSFDLIFSIQHRGIDSNRGFFLAMFGKENILKFANIVNKYIDPEMGMSNDRVSGVNKAPWNNTDVMDYLKNNITLNELKCKKVVEYF